MDFPSRYDVAYLLPALTATLQLLSATHCTSRSLVFYDKNEQHRMLAEDVEDHLRSIYQTDLTYLPGTDLESLVGVRGFVSYLQCRCAYAFDASGRAV